MQYAGLSLYVVAQAVILLPLLYICIRVLGEPQLPVMAALITAICFIGLTAFAFVTGVDFSGWGKFLALGGLVAMGVIVAGIFFGFSLGLWFSGLMVVLACGYILYDTSNIMHHYATDQYVAASLGSVRVGGAAVLLRPSDHDEHVSRLVRFVVRMKPTPSVRTMDFQVRRTGKRRTWKSIVR